MIDADSSRSYRSLCRGQALAPANGCLGHDTVLFASWSEHDADRVSQSPATYKRNLSRSHTYLLGLGIARPHLLDMGRRLQW